MRGLSVKEGIPSRKANLGMRGADCLVAEEREGGVSKISKEPFEIALARGMEDSRKSEMG